MTWKTLKHNGIAIPPVYKPIGIKIIFKNKAYNICPVLEESLYLYLQYNSKYKDKVFKLNFLKSIKKYLPKSLTNSVTSIDEISFHKTKLMTKPFKIPINYNKYKFCYIDGERHSVEKYMAEPAYIFSGRGVHILRGSFKPAVLQSDIIINSSSKIPGKWSNVTNNEVNWIACWKDQLLNKFKYIYPSQSKNSINKFDFAKILSKKINKIRVLYSKDLHCSDVKKNQLSLATYLIDTFCIRCGTESDDSNDVVGCTTLLCKHIHTKNNNITLNFIGKDSIEFNKTIHCKIPIVVYLINKNLKSKNQQSPFFDLISSQSLNTYLDSLLKNLTAKVFRTCHASKLLCKCLNKIKSIDEYKQSISKVAQLCNHTNTQTCKSNYIDPRIVVSFSKRENIPIEKLYSSNLIKKYEWALNTQTNYTF